MSRRNHAVQVVADAVLVAPKWVTWGRIKANQRGPGRISATVQAVACQVAMLAEDLLQTLQVIPNTFPDRVVIRLGWSQARLYRHRC